MPRPKGSKNKKSIKPLADISGKIEAQIALIASITDEKEKIAAAITEQKAALKGKTKELKAAQKVLAKLQEQKATAETMEKAAQQKAQIESVVSQLVSSGKSAEEILALLAQQ